MGLDGRALFRMEEEAALRARTDKPMMSVTRRYSADLRRKVGRNIRGEHIRRPDRPDFEIPEGEERG